MYKFAFTYLVKQDNKNWKDFKNSLNLLHKKILTKISCKFKVLIFCEGEPTIEAISLINNLLENNIEIIIKKICLQKYVGRDSSEIFLDYMPYLGNFIETFSIGYRDMCKFFAIDIFNDEELNNAKYYVRLDTDSLFLDVRKQFIKSLENIKEDYAFIETTIQKENKRVSYGFGNCLYRFCKLNISFMSLPKNYKLICKEATYNPKIFYTNFEVIKISWIKNSQYSKFLSHIINYKGIYYYRWGDALIRYYSIKLIGANLLKLKGCLYKHQNLFDSRSFILRLASFIYAKFKQKLLRDNFEKDLNYIDDFFLNIK